MKRILTLALSLLLVLTLIPFSAVSATAEEADGATQSATTDDTAVYTEVADYTALMAQITDGTIEKSLRLTGNIVFPTDTVITEELATLANGVVIDGNGYSMTGFSMSASAADLALFAVADGATVTIKNLTIGSDAEGGAITFDLAPTAANQSFSVIAATVAAGSSLHLNDVDVYASITWKSGSYNDVNCAGFVASVNGSVSFYNCSMNGSVTFKSGQGSYPNVAGFVGLAESTSKLVFNACENNAKIDAQSRATGFVSNLKAISLEMNNCKNNGNVNGCYYVGGFIGDMLPTTSSTAYTISNCTNNGTVSGIKYMTGGFIARAEFFDKNATLLIEKSVNAGDVSAKEASATTLTKDTQTGTGGFIGQVRANKTYAVKIVNCVNTGNITNPTDMVGGIVGFVFAKSIHFPLGIEYAVNAGTVSGGCYTGGLVGGFFKWNKIYFTQCLSVGDVTSEGGYVGPFIGAHQDIVSNGVDFYNEEYYTVTGGGYFCTLTNGVDGGENDESKIHIGTLNKSTTPITKYASAGDALYIAGNVCTTGTFGYDNATQEFTFTKNPELPRYVGVQVSNEYVNAYSDTVRDARFVAVLDEAYTSYDKVGFKYTAINGEGASIEGDISDTVVYNAILANTVGGMATYTAEKLGGKHIFALVLTDIPTVGNATFEITAYAVTGETELTEGCKYVVEFENGVCVASDMVID